MEGSTRAVYLERQLLVTALDKYEPFTLHAPVPIRIIHNKNIFMSFWHDEKKAKKEQFETSHVTRQWTRKVNKR